MMRNFLLLLCGFLAALASQKIFSADDHKNHTMHSPSMHETQASSLPTQGGQATFAALIEIISMLENNPQTDWSRVSIDKLRAHLMDMDKLMLETNASTSIANGKTLSYEVRGTSASVGAIHNMARAHGHYMQQTRGWNIDTSLTEHGATVTITVNDLKDVALLQALGFYGYMSLDSHHAEHHYQIALGKGH